MLSTMFAAALFVGSAVSEAPRYYPKFGGAREVTTLDGLWSYGYIDGGDGSHSSFDAMSPSFKPEDSLTPTQTQVPSCSDVVAGGASGYLGPRGTSFYKTTFTAPAGDAPVRLQFQSCSFYCRIFVNGKEVGDHHAGGYVAFWLDVPSDVLLAGDKNELFVLADNRFNATTAPMHTGGDFWHYGGLIRSVELHTMAAGSAPVLWRAYVQPTGAGLTLPEGEQVSVPTNVDITLQLSDENFSGPVKFSLAFDGGAAEQKTGVAKDGQLKLSGVPVPMAKAWSPSSPNLHTLTVGMSDGTVTERFGLRTFGVDKDTARLTINGKILKLVGWNHHTQWPVTAASPTDAQLDADIALLKKGNANYVRGAHYPHDPRMLDRLDEAGMVFWSETLGPSVSAENTKDARFMKYQMQQLSEMLDNAMNHAAIMAWGWFNEGPSSDVTACPAYGMCADYSKTRDPTRFTTWADDKDNSAKCYEHASLIAYNNYPGWYSQADPTSTWERNSAAVRAGGPNGTLGKPFVISETGAGGIFEWDNNDTSVKWTLQYQSKIISADVDVAIANENISGITLWHFNDFKVDNCGSKWPCPHQGGGVENNTHCEYDHAPPTTFEDLEKFGPPNCSSYIEVNNRPGGENHKGSVDFWRREKPIFGIVSKKYAMANL